MADANNHRRRYEDWVRDYSASLYRSAYRMTGQAAAAEDIVQETFYHAWRSRKSLKDQNKAASWLYSILRHRYAHWVRDQVRRPKMMVMDEGMEHPRDRSRPPLQQLADREALQKALDALDDRFKTVFLMVFLEGLTCRETAEKLELPLGTVLSRIHRARRFLRAQLNGQDEEAARPVNNQPPNGHFDDGEGRLRIGG